MYIQIVDTYLKTSNTIFQTTLTLILKQFQSYLYTNDIKKYYSNISLDTNFSFEIFDEVKKQGPFLNLLQDCQGAYAKHERLLTHLQADTQTSVLNVLSTLPQMQKNLLNAYLQTNVNYKKFFITKQESLKLIWIGVLEKFYKSSKHFMYTYYTSVEEKKNKCKEILKDKIKKYLKNNYQSFLQDVLSLYDDIHGLESLLNLETKTFSTDLEISLVECKMYLKELEDREINVSDEIEKKENNIDCKECKESDSQVFQMHEVLKLKSELFGNKTTNLLILQQIEDDLNTFSKPSAPPATQDEIPSQKPEIKIEAYQKRLQILELTFIEIKNNIYEIMKDIQDEFVNKQKLEKQETIKSILKEFTMYYKQKEKEIQDICVDIHKKLTFQETLLETLQKEINEQKKQFKDLAFKLDICIKHFNEQTKLSLLQVEKDGYQGLQESMQNILKNLETL